MIHRCETCPFWKQRKNLSFGTCDKANADTEVMLWAEYSHMHEEPTVFTDKSFGCVMHPMNKAIA